MSNLNIAILDDHPLFRDALKSILAGSWPDAEILEFDRFRSLHQHLNRRHDVELILADLNTLDDFSTLNVCHLRAANPALPIVIISTQDDDRSIQKCKSLGLSGYISKSAPGADIRQAIASVLSGDVSFPDDCARDEEAYIARLARRFAMLTPRQLQVALGVAEGKLNKQIASDIGASEGTVKSHLSAIFDKLEVDNRTQLVIAVGELEDAPLPVSG